MPAPGGPDTLQFPVGVAVSPDGRVAVADFSRGEVAIVGPDGEWMGNAVPAGTASGEALAPIAVAWRSGGELLVWDVAGSRVLALAPGASTMDDGPVASDFNEAMLAAGEVVWAALRRDGTVLTIRRERIGLLPDGLELQRESLFALDPGESRPRSIVADTFETASGWPRPGTVALTVATSPSGALAYADPDGGYRLHVTSATGERLLICRDLAGLPVTAAELGEGAPEEWRNLADALAAVGPSENPATAGRLLFDAEERLWVQRERPQPFGGTERLHGVPGATYDVFGSDGALLGSLTAPPGARVQTALGDTLWTLRSAETGGYELVAYEIQ